MDLLQHIRDKGLKATPARLKIIKFLDSSQQAYSHAELETLFSKLDRVTLYRILNDLAEVGLLHKIIDMEGVTRFAVCKDSCSDGLHVDDHVHFNCKVCHRMFCLEKVQTPILKMPLGFKTMGLQTLIYGLCNNCSVA